MSGVRIITFHRDMRVTVNGVVVGSYTKHELRTGNTYSLVNRFTFDRTDPKPQRNMLIDDAIAIYEANKS